MTKLMPKFPSLRYARSTSIVANVRVTNTPTIAFATWNAQSQILHGHFDAVLVEAENLLYRQRAQMMRASLQLPFPRRPNGQIMGR